MQGWINGNKEGWKSECFCSSYVMVFWELWFKDGVLIFKEVFLNIVVSCVCNCNAPLSWCVTVAGSSTWWGGHGQTFTLPGPAKSHTSSLTKGLTCPRCQRTYSLNYTLDRHMRYECGVEKKFVCPVCMRRFSRNDILNTHRRNFRH